MKIEPLHSRDAFPMQLLLQADPSEEMVKKYIHRGKCFVSKVDDQIVGVYILLPTRLGTAEIVNISVMERFQGKGIGRHLIHHAIMYAKSQGYKTIEIGTGNSSIGQLALYQKCGFRITGVDRDFFIRHYNEEIVENGIVCCDMIRLAQEL